MSRASTLLLALLVLNTLLGVLCLVVSRGERGSRALRLWGWGRLVYSAGILVTIPAALPFHLRKVIGNSLIALAPILNVEGALAYTRVKLNRRWLAAGFLASVVPILWNHLGNHFEVLIDILAPAPLANILFIVAAVALIRVPPPDAKSASRFVAGIFLFSVLVWSCRMVAIWSSIGGTNDRDRADLTIALFGIAQMVIAVACTLGLLWIEVRIIEAALRRLANSDALTGLSNRRATVAMFDDEAARASRRNRSFALALFDIDHFKRINDSQGHLVGDAALRHVADVMMATKRDVDTVGRIGGEEFVVIFSEEGPDGALGAANRVRQRIAESDLDHDGTTIHVTVSGGVAVYPMDGTDWDSLFAVADRRMYTAKNAGRNRVAATDQADAIGTEAQHR
jgi:diguanylate cyclase (GGDEF)-like protein